MLKPRKVNGLNVYKLLRLVKFLLFQCCQPFTFVFNGFILFVRGGSDHLCIVFFSAHILVACHPDEKSKCSSRPAIGAGKHHNLCKERRCKPQKKSTINTFAKIWQYTR